MRLSNTIGMIFGALVVVMTSQNASAQDSTKENHSKRMVPGKVYWANKHDEMVPIEKLSDEQLLYYGSYSSNLKDQHASELTDEIKRRKLIPSNSSPSNLSPTISDEKNDLPRITPRKKPDSKEKNTSKFSSKTVRDISALVRSIENEAYYGRKRMKWYRDMIHWMRNLNASEPIGNLQTVENLSNETDEFYKKMQSIAKILRQLTDLEKDRVSLYLKRVDVLSNQISKNEAIIKKEYGKIRLVVRKRKHPTRFLQGQGLRN